MNNDPKSSKFKELLDKLQQESWQLELLITGFAIFGLINLIEPIQAALNESKALQSYGRFFYPIIITACYILIINLVIHVILRGLWIGAIGLRYVSNDIDYDELNYSKRFTNYLKKKVGSFDGYIARLENYCSILFAVTFLTLFYLISFFLVFFLLMIAANFFIESGFFSKFVGVTIFGFFSIFFLFLCIIVFIDFITLGYLKKKEWSSFLYMPIYKVFSIITLSFLYRPLVYNLLDNKFGRRIAFLLLPLYMSILYISTLDNVRSNYLSINSHSSVNYSNNNNYLDLLEKNEFVKNVAIPTKIVNKPYITVFIPFKKETEDIILQNNKKLVPEKDERGLNNRFFKSFSKKKGYSQKRDSIYSKYLATFNNTYNIAIDTIKFSSDFIINKTNKQLGFESIVSLKDIQEGKHLISIKRKVLNSETQKEEIERVAEIPFWYYKSN
ncbi:hypothetical protein H3Z83_01795 [Tenacibaculum sp. S7007]|uniref:Uncharacterized protein n=1 Tax=Tenacibaculum pelagium TaxID=2759527 RepID=A0A839ALL9_9FLAO|nr:hypothetical protein [Tenacibaculum pelagium]MBA6155260.1 hypothetical protein [Tenacibaculum pelagium]